MLELKAKRRIRRFIRTGEHQARVYPLDKRNKFFEYKVKHYVKSIYFKRSWFGWITRVESPNT
jgi:hypothetical protein